ncbi:hypothetical protein G1K66_08610 [Tenacibaculum finnmarkense]|uniref:hypothetical protein n=1 Tax=Tenacibaculum finnmarkense TaxID=2781243 RepID=UPI001E5BDA2C|nr:hypothetical protein [Tenacibaculum finnmarkense]MCD8430380.1 hypothetical protein [Tenacibaculum finnmarkense genomovar ulcerans]MCG8813322.1 hypothetical protein [Tenacibaculum finnmarkense]
MIEFLSKTPKSFRLDLTDVNITLVEENPMFFNYFVKRYTWPFSKQLDDKTTASFGFLDLDNVIKYATKFHGTLIIDDVFNEAYLVISQLNNGKMEGSIYYGKETNVLFSEKLSTLPFKLISTDQLFVHAKETITKSYPDVGYNFPMIIDIEKKKNSNYEQFEGIVNNFEDGDFKTNYNTVVAGEKIINNNNLLIPMPYLMEVLKVGFATKNIIMNGSFVSDTVNNKILLYTDKILEKFYSGLISDFQLIVGTEVWKDNYVKSNYSRTQRITEVGTYTINILMAFPNDIQILDFNVTYKGEVIYRSTKNNINKKLLINAEDSDALGSIKFSLKLQKYSADVSVGIGNISAYNNISFDLKDGELNVFPNTFSLSQLMPDITFGAFLNKVKNWLNLEITFDKNVVNINYIEQKFLETDLKDERHLEPINVSRVFNQNKLYELKDHLNALYISSDGLQDDSQGYKLEDITTIDVGFKKMRRTSLNGVFTATKTKEEDGFSFVLFDGLQNGLPVTVDKIDGRNFSLKENYERNWRKWLQFRLNSETYKDKFPAHILEKFQIGAGRFKYNKKHLYKSIKKKRISNNHWRLDVESETML